MDHKEYQANQYERKNRFHNKIKSEALQLLYNLDSTRTIRYAIQATKERRRRALSGQSLGKVFQGNSNKYQKDGGECRIMNKVQKRNNQKKQKLTEQI